MLRQSQRQVQCFAWREAWVLTSGRFGKCLRVGVEKQELNTAERRAAILLVDHAP